MIVWGDVGAHVRALRFSITDDPKRAQDGHLG